MDDGLKISRRRYLLAVTLALLTVLLALASRWEAAHHFITGEASACRISDALDCDKVQTSEYATVLGVSLASWGIGGGILMAALLIVFRTTGWALLLRLAGLLALFDLIAALALFGIATFAIGATCLYCLGIQICCLLSAIVVVPVAWRVPGLDPPDPPSGRRPCSAPPCCCWCWPARPGSSNAPGSSGPTPGPRVPRCASTSPTRWWWATRTPRSRS